MTELTALFAALGGLAFILANIAVWSPRKLRVKVSALAAAAIFLPASYLSLSEMLGRPKPVETEWFRRAASEATVVGSQMQKGKAIYVWLSIEGIDEPRAYALPWSEGLARQLHGARRASNSNGSPVRMRLPFERSLDRQERMFYASPRPPPPVKQVPVQNPLNFQRSQTGTGAANN